MLSFLIYETSILFRKRFNQQPASIIVVVTSYIKKLFTGMRNKTVKCKNENSERDSLQDKKSMISVVRRFLVTSTERRFDDFLLKPLLYKSDYDKMSSNRRSVEATRRYERPL